MLNKKYTFKQLFTENATFDDGGDVKKTPSKKTSLFEDMQYRTKEEIKKFWQSEYGWGPTESERQYLDELKRIKQQKRLEHEASQPHKEGFFKSLFKKPQMKDGGKIGTPEWTDEVTKRAETEFYNARISADPDDFIDYIQEAAEQEVGEILPYPVAVKYYEDWIKWNKKKNKSKHLP